MWHTDKLKKQTVKDIQKCIDILKTVDNRRFDMSVFFKDHPTYADLRCGTSACALGWLTTDKNIRKRGLKSYGALIEYRKAGELFLGFDAAAQAFLKIHHRDVSRLFGPGRRTVKQEIDILEKFLKEVPQ